MSLTIELIHTLVILAQVAAGVCLSGAPALWLRGFAELCLSLTLGLAALMAAADALFSRLGRPLQARPAPPKRLAELAESMRAMVVFSGFAAWPRLLLAQGRPTALVSLAQAQPEAPDAVALYALKLVGVTLLVDFYMYIKHRLLHWGSNFAYHKQHHAFTSPSPFASFAVAPVEAALTFAPVLALCLPSAPVWAAAYAVWTGCFVLLNLYLHSGVRVQLLEALALAGLNTSSFHDWHHESGGRENFGELCYLWDYALSSGAHPARREPEGEGAQPARAKGVRRKRAP